MHPLRIIPGSYREQHALLRQPLQRFLPAMRMLHGTLTDRAFPSGAIEVRNYALLSRETCGRSDDIVIDARKL